MTQTIEPPVDTGRPLRVDDPTTEDSRLARESIVTADELIALAIDAARGGDPQRASELVGRSSNAIAVALYHLRQAKRLGVPPDPSPP